MLKENRQRRHRRMKKCVPAAGHQTGRGQADQQQQTNAAFHAARGVHQQCHRDHIKRDLSGQMVGDRREAPVRGSHCCRSGKEIKRQRPSR